MLSRFFGLSSTERSANAAIVSAIAATIGIALAVATLFYVVYFQDNVDNKARAAVMETSTAVASLSASLLKQIDGLVDQMNTLNTDSSNVETRLSKVEREVAALQREMQELKLMQQPQPTAK